MNHTINKIKTILKTKPSNPVLLFLTGFFFAQFMLINILSTIHPSGGWVANFGSFSAIFTTTSILVGILFALSLCLVALWFSVVKQEKLKEDKTRDSFIVKTRSNYSPIDYPRGSTEAVVPGYVFG